MIRASLKYNLLATLWAPPFYYKDLSEDGVVVFYKECLERINDKSLNVILYNYPSNTCVPLTHAIVERLYALFPDNIMGLKDSGYVYDGTLAYIKKYPHLKIYVGKDIDTSSLVSQGAVGTISAFANIAPNLMNSVYEYGLDNTKPNRNDEINKLWNIVFQHYFISSMKGIVSTIKNEKKWNIVRPPLFSLTPAEANELVRQIKHSNINK